MHKNKLVLLLAKRAILPSLILTICVPSAIAYANEDENINEAGGNVPIENNEQVENPEPANAAVPAEAAEAVADAVPADAAAVAAPADALATTPPNDTIPPDALAGVLDPSLIAEYEVRDANTIESVPAPVINPGYPSVLDEILSAPSEVYNHNLAVISAELSSKAYSDGGSDVATYLGEYGFDNDSIRSYNYDDCFAYTLAVKDYYGTEAPENTKVLVMDARGTSTLTELAYDVYTTPDVDYNGVKVYTAADKFYREIQENLGNFLTTDNHYKILSTGHSLGGAAANLFAGVETQKKQNEVYCYTFGAIDSIESPIVEGYENIHNIYNDLDTFSPSQYGSYLLGGAGSKYGKFGHMDSYTEEHRTPEQQDDWGIVQIYDHVNHNMNYYVEDTKALKYQCPEAIGGDDGSSETATDIVQENTAPDAQESAATPASIPAMPKDLANVILNTHNGKTITGAVRDKNDIFAQNIQLYAATLKAEIIYSASSQGLDSTGLTLGNVITVKDAQGQVIVMMELINTTDQDISIGINSVIADGLYTNVTPWKSDVIPAGKSIAVAIPLSDLTSNYMNSTVSLHIYGNDGKEITTTSAIRVTPAK